jgi:tryptophan synthase beta chain
MGTSGSGETSCSTPPVRDALRLWRPTPLHRARRLERELGTPARIYYTRVEPR